jgi:hypothetical protein
VGSFIFLFLAMFLASTVPSVVHAQATGELTGTITDSSGAVIPGAKVTATNEATGITSEVTSNNNGHYTVPFLRPGGYRIDVQQEGFRGVSRAGVQLQVAQAVKVDFALEVGAVTETIDVTDTTPLLDAATNVIGGVVTTDKLMNIPLKGRNTNAFMHLVPGVKVQRGSLNQPVLESHWQFFSINGNRPNQNLFLLDGGNNNDTGFNGPEYTAQVDLVQEFRVHTNNFSAEFANSAGGVINTVTKSGANELHGSLFEYFRNDRLQAINYFAKLTGQVKPPLRHNQFGGTLGGPIKKNKTFFFGSFEGLRLRLPAGSASTAAGLVNIISVPTDLQLKGDFSGTLTNTGALVSIYDPTSTRPDPNSPGKFIRTQFANNRIPDTMINPVTRKVAGYYPKPNNPGDQFTQLNNFFFSGSQPQTTDDMSVRIDHQFNDSTSIFGRYSKAWVNIGAPPLFGEGNIADPYNANTDQTHMSAVVNLTKIFSPTMVGEFLVSMNRFFHYRTQLSTENFDPTELGIPGYLRANTPVTGFPQFNVDGMSRVGGFIYERHAYDRPYFSATVTRTSGKHGLKFGGAYHVGRLNGITFTQAAGQYTFGKDFTQGSDPFQSGPQSGLGFATFLLGSPTVGAHLPIGVDTSASAKYTGFFIQDDYKMTSRLTLNLGLRWDLESPRTERYNRLTNFDFDGTATLSNGKQIRGGLMFPSVGGLDRGQWDRELTNFSPRFGFAYNLADKTVLRGGFGVFYGNSWGGAANYNQLANVGFRCSTSMTTTLDGGLTPAATMSDPFPNGFCTPTGSSLGLLSSLGQNVAAVDRDHKITKSVQWSFDVQRQLPKDVVLELTYTGNRGLNLVGRNQLNQLHPDQLKLGSQLNSRVPNPFFGVIQTGPLAAQTITLAQAIRPYPHFLQAESPIVMYGASTYHALYAKLERRFANGFSLLGSYTFSKVIDDTIASVAGFAGGGTVIGNVQNFYNLRGERSISSFNRPQVLVISYVWELPFGPGKRYLNHSGLAGKIIGGWQINGMTTFSSGDALQITGGNSSGSLEGTQRPNWSGKNGTISGGSVKDRLGRYFDTSVFSFNDPFTFGNAPRIMPNLYGPGTNNFDISLFKNTQLTERLKLQFRVEAFNAFNRIQFGNPATSINANNFGRINTQVNFPRDYQFALKLLF